MSPSPQGLLFVQLVRGLEAFKSTLDAQDRVEAHVDLFRGALPTASDLDEHAAKTLVGGEIVEKLHEWTKVVREVPNSAEMMVVLADHLTVWFDSQVEHGVNYDHSKRVRALFADLDFAGDKVIDRTLVEQICHAGKELLDIPVAPMGSAVSEGEDDDQDELAPETNESSNNDVIVEGGDNSTTETQDTTGDGNAATEDANNSITDTHDKTSDLVVDVVGLQQSNPSARVQQAVRRRSVIRRRRRSSRVCDSVGAQSGRWNAGVDVTEFEAIVNDTIGASPDDAAWNELCRTYIDVSCASYHFVCDACRGT